MTSQVGGAIIGQGDYGCLFKDPAPTCESGNPIKSEVGKVTVTSGYGMQEEKKKTAILKQIPELEPYIIVPTESCKAAPTQEDEDWQKCKLTATHSEFMILGMKDGGRTPKQALEKPAYLCRNFLSVLEHLLEGLLLLHAAGWIHTDIHDNNIMINHAGTPLFIDFGLAFNKQNPNKEEMDNYSQFNPALVFMPPEYHVYSLFMRNRDLPTAIQEIANSLQYQNLASFFQKVIPVKQVLEDLANDSTVHTDSVTFYQKRGEKLDVWSLGVAFYNAFLHCLMWPLNYKVPEFKNATPRIKTILALMLEFNPQQRGSVKQVLELVNPYNRFLRVNRLLAPVPKPPPFSNNIRMRRGTLKNPQNKV